MKKLIIMQGLPASGKSTFRKSFFSHFEVVDCDELKKTIKGYDEKNPHRVHAKSKILEKAKLYQILNDGFSFVYDSTSTNIEKILMLIDEAKGLGYSITLAKVEIPLEVAIERNAKRERVVPKNVIIEKNEMMKYAHDVIKNYVDEILLIDGLKGEIKK